MEKQTVRGTIAEQRRAHRGPLLCAEDEFRGQTSAQTSALLLLTLTDPLLYR